MDGHSRGSLTIDSTLNSLMKSPNAQGLLSKTTVSLYGPVANVKDLDNKLAHLQGRNNISDEIQKYLMRVTHETHFADPVSRLIGGNPGTGGIIPKESNVYLEGFKMTFGEKTVHNCYGAGGGDKCDKYRIFNNENFLIKKYMD